MRAAIVADWIRVRGRRDVWIALAGVSAAAALIFLSSFLTSVAHLEFGPGTPVEITLGPEAAALRAPFAFPQSVLTILAGTWPLSLAAAYLGFATVGAEFAFGTIRPSLIMAESRRVFLGARCLVLLGLIVALGFAILLLGLVLPLTASLLKGPMPEVPSPPPLGVAAEYGARVLAAFAFASVGIFFAVTTRSLIGGTSATLLYVLLEAIIGSNFRSGSLAFIGQLSMTGSTTAVIDNAHRVAGGVLPVDEVERIALEAPPVIDPALSLVVAFGWVAALLAASFVILDRADITD
jgi:ABC-type transport system involved in multi-copper enzyme maturation permease subunit